MALTGESLLEVGCKKEAFACLEWSARVRLVDGLFFQKYCPDGSLGPGWHPRLLGGERITPVQSDETALTCCLVAKCREAGISSKEVDEASKLWLQGLRDYTTSSGLPKPSWDLWEERRGTWFFTILVTVDALRLNGFQHDADRMLEAALSGLKLPGGGWARGWDDSGKIDPTPDASQIAALIRFPELLASPDGLKTLERVEAQCLDQTAVGGCARYPNDYYWRQGSAPSNPWLICTLWLAQAWARLGDPDRALPHIQWALKHAHSTGSLPEQVSSVDGRPLSVSPLTWSHAEMLIAIKDEAEARMVLAEA